MKILISNYCLSAVFFIVSSLGAEKSAEFRWKGTVYKILGICFSLKIFFLALTSQKPLKILYKLNQSSPFNAQVFPCIYAIADLKDICKDTWLWMNINEKLSVKKSNHQSTLSSHPLKNHSTLQLLL